MFTANFTEGQIVAICLLTVFILTIWAIKLICFNRLTFVDSLISVIIFVVCLFVKLATGWIIFLIVLDSLVLLYALASLVLIIYAKKEISDKTTEYLKNTEYDFFIQMNYNEKITDCSSSLLKLLKLSKKEVLHNRGWKFIFDSFDIKSLNKQEFSLDYVTQFLAEFKECNSKHKRYKFQMEIETKNQDNPDETEIVKYDAIVQPIFIGKMLVARNIYFYQDKLAVIDKLKNLVRNACVDLEDAYLQLDVMMSLSEGVIMYYDFQNKVYVATECMRIYTNTTKKEYTFEELFAKIHPDDVNSYIEQAETVNSLSVTKIKYRMKIGPKFYQVEEDSIYMRKDYGLISILRISEQQVYQNAKTKNELEILNNLTTKNISNTVNKTEDILNTILGEKVEDDH